MNRALLRPNVNTHHMPATMLRRVMIADPDAGRRHRILSKLDGITAIEAASLSEAFDLAESAQPHVIAMAAELSADAGLGMFLHLIDALSVAIVMYGAPSTDRTPLKFRKSIDFVDLSDHRGESRLIQTLTRLPAETGHAPIGAIGAAVCRAQTQPDLIVIGASTGGVSALETVLTAFPAACPPTLVVQHIRPGFIDGMIRRLNQRCSPEVVAACDAMCPQQGQICVAADTERHLVLQSGDLLRCRLKPTDPRHGHRPSVDALFESAAGRPGVAAALLTGMGADGAEGMAKIRTAGGLTIAQNEETCVVYGMPRVAVEIGAASMVLPLEMISHALLGRITPKATGRRAERVR